ncbi:hypothetical protein AVEN_63492-1 [Araneus ventricosus]|uniref:Uncharacterized protein n=1 Tax=Araneus ventricosus TaxID=182803 RepID=A0A4Y2CT64_ARAVE|nr:hypothetical protein AVEN_63492-1 [Araneus ventricosus]
MTEKTTIFSAFVTIRKEKVFTENASYGMDDTGKWFWKDLSKYDDNSGPDCTVNHIAQQEKRLCVLAGTYVHGMHVFKCEYRVAMFALQRLNVGCNERPSLIILSNDGFQKHDHVRMVIGHFMRLPEISEGCHLC